jgi:hypothetical protein
MHQIYLFEVYFDRIMYNVVAAYLRLRAFRFLCGLKAFYLTEQSLNLVMYLNCIYNNKLF